jgi:glycosylphosphatidylinositol transamidase
MVNHQPEEQIKLKWRRKLPLLLFAPYLVGVFWHALHPVASVFTGHMQPRKWYIDENSLEPSYFKMKGQFDALTVPTGWQRRSLCATVSRNARIFSCTQHPDGFEILKMTPKQVAVRPVTEAIVLVIPWNASYVSNVFQVAVVNLIQQLQQANWIAKTLFIVTSTVESEMSLTSTVNRFLDVYLGSADQETPFHPPLPHDMNGFLLRNLLVVDVQPQTQNGLIVSTSIPAQPEIRILPQGRRGVLPNMDLVFLAMLVYSRSMYIRTNKAVITMHPYRQGAKQIQEYVQSKLITSIHSKEFQEWLPKMLELLAFEYSLLLGPYPPHATALDRGIDALTIQALFTPGVDPNRFTSDCIQRLEYVLRALSNLHERLHHSTSLYLLASPERFVKHEEYLVPNLLLLIPLAVRAVTLVLVDIPAFHWPTVQQTIFLTLSCVTTFHAVVSEIDKEMIVPAFLLIYATTALFLRFGLRRLSKQTVQFVSCVTALLVHIPIAFGHVSLAFPSALFWAPLIAFPSFDTSNHDRKNTNRTLIWVRSVLWYALSIGVIGITLPCILLVPKVFPDYTIYLRYAYMPLHALLAILYLS